MHQDLDHQSTRYYNSNRSQKEVNPPRNIHKEDSRTDNIKPKPKTRNDREQNSQSNSLKCNGSCNSTFTHKDEMDLHMKFFDETPSSSQTQ